MVSILWPAIWLDPAALVVRITAAPFCVVHLRPWVIEPKRKNSEREGALPEPRGLGAVKNALGAVGVVLAARAVVAQQPGQVEHGAGHVRVLGPVHFLVDLQSLTEEILGF